MPNTQDHATYIAAAAENLQPLLKDLRAILARILPDAEQIISYNMPGFRIDNTIIAG